MVFSAAPDATPRWAAIIARIMPELCPAQARGAKFSGAERESARPFRIIANGGVAPLRGPRTATRGRCRRTAARRVHRMS
jgi:hypothetical protein